MNAVTISDSEAGGMHKGDGRSLSGWIRRKALVPFVVPVTGGIGQPVSLVAPVSGSVAGVIRNQERRKEKAQLIRGKYRDG